MTVQPQLHQLSYFADSMNGGSAASTLTQLGDLGTFKDSRKAPIHRWFKYPAGYSYKFVDALIQYFGVSKGGWIYDPFSGTGTTIMVAKQQGLNGYGVEAHEFVHWVAKVKLHWEFDLKYLITVINDLLQKIGLTIKQNIESVSTEGAFPELVYKCYHPTTLKELLLIRNFILEEVGDEHIQDLLKLGLTDTLREAAAAGTGWPYIAPRKNLEEQKHKPAFPIFRDIIYKMYDDLTAMPSGDAVGEAFNILGDSRQRQDLDNGQIDLALTSPPYLNNYDYADRTRLETYFWGLANTWKDITEQYRNKLMVAATTQVQRSLYNVESTLTSEIAKIDSELYGFLQKSVLELARLRTTKGGKKDYDLMVALYFNDLLEVIKETYRLLKPGGHFCLVLGDSAPYGVHIPTEDVVGRLGVGIGFEKYEYIQFRTRGGKWKANPQRHDVALQEGVVILTK